MNILVCIKQVPDTTGIKIDPVKNTLVRAEVPSILNTLDSYTLEAAVRMKDKDPDTKVVVISMGPIQAKTSLKEYLSAGGDKVYLITDRAFGGFDTLVTSYILCNAVKKIEELEGKFDAIFCGKQAIDRGTSQVGSELAEHLGYPQVTYGLEAEAVGDEVHVKKETKNGTKIIAINTPCIVTFTKPSFDCRYPSVEMKRASNRAEIHNITAADLVEINFDKENI